jgi:hypothetical protein
MSSEPKRCPFCNAVMTPGQRTCPNPECGNPYPFDDEPTTNLPPSATTPGRAGRAAGGSRGERGSGGAGGSLGGLAPNKTILVLIGVLVLIVLVGFLLFRFGMSFFEAGRPDPSTLATSTAGPVVVPSPPALINGSPVAGASPSPGTVISPPASPSPAAGGVRLKVANTEGQGANMRQRPSTTAPVLRTLTEGTVVEAIGGEQDAENRKWRNVRDPGGATGWVASDLLSPE